ncbi:MAG: FmdB family transcriptional regulator [Spirochaetes bacterium]|nr:FmdB family transcriptional regulator [Spirochaetota bacterium]
MPTYEYECMECKNRFEVFQSIHDDPVQTCSVCSGKVRKLFGTAGIIFKGSGFYVNDYKKNGGSRRNTAPEKSGDTSGPASDSSATSSCSTGTSE